MKRSLKRKKCYIYFENMSDYFKDQHAYGIEPDEQSPGEIIYLSHIPGEMFFG